VSDAVCTNDFIVTVTKGGAPKEGENVTFAVAPTVSTTDFGKVEPSSGTTNAAGQVTAKYCAGDTETKVVITAKAGEKEAASPQIEVVKKPTYTFTYVGTEDQDASSSTFVPALLNFLADTTTLALTTPNTPTPAEAVKLNLLGGGKDRINLLFAATVSGVAYAGASATFRSQFDFPIGSKLALCTDTATTAKDTVTNKTYLQYTAVGNSAGVFRVPVCAARMPGNLLVTGILTAGTGVGAKTIRAEANAIRFEGGLANYGNMSASFDTVNAKVMKASFVSNTGVAMNFQARLQSRLDGVLANENPLGVLTEYGKVTLTNDGTPSQDGTVAFTIEPLNSSGQRPLRITSKAISNGTDYDIMCTPSKFSDTSAIVFSDLAKDWRSTVMYYVKGQEQYFDANFNGQYDIANSVGFWDRNQNGVFDCSDEGVCDMITFVDPNKTDNDLTGVTVGKVPFSTGCPTTTCLTQLQQSAIYKHDWFIDMSSPFVDADENGDQRETDGTPQLSEYVVGDTFQPPNGRLDSEAYIWKSFVLPLYVGTSPYAMTHRTISKDLSRVFKWVDATNNDLDSSYAGGLAKFFKDTGYDQTLWDSTASSGDATSTDPTLANHEHNITGADKTLFGCHTNFNPTTPDARHCKRASILIPDATPGTSITHQAGATIARYFFAQGTCGSPLPGGTELKVSFWKDGSESEVLTAGGRKVSAHFYMQPNDWTLEPSRRLLSEAVGKNTAKINLDPLGHPASKYSYPIQFFINVSACTTACTGEVLTEGNYCPAVNASAHLTADSDSIGEWLSIGMVKTCTCVAKAIFNNGACSCPTGMKSDGVSCI
jgi:hypothetical protein